MSERIFDFLVYEGADGDKGRNGFRVTITDAVREDPTILAEYLQYAIKQPNRSIRQKTGTSLRPLAIHYEGIQNVQQSTLFTAANKIASQLIEIDKDKKIEALYIEDDFKTPDPIEE